MSKCDPAEIKKIERSRKASHGYIKVSMQPDLTKFSSFENEEQRQDFLSLLKRRVYDLAACNPGLKVFLNNERIPVNGM
jgi:DNA topoisomerase-2